MHLRGNYRPSPYRGALCSVPCRQSTFPRPHPDLLQGFHRVVVLLKVSLLSLRSFLSSCARVGREVCILFPVARTISSPSVVG